VEFGLSALSSGHSTKAGEGRGTDAGVGDVIRYGRKTPQLLSNAPLPMNQDTTTIEL